MFINGEDVHLVMGEVFYVGAYTLDLSTMTLGCRVGVVKVPIYQLQHFCNRVGVVRDASNIDTESSTADNVHGHAYVTFLDGVPEIKSLTEKNDVKKNSKVGGMKGCGMDDDNKSSSGGEGGEESGGDELIDPN